MKFSNLETENILSAIKAAGYSDMVADQTETEVVVSIIDAESEECLAEIRKHLPAGATADFAGTGDTDAHGETTEDIRIEWSAE